MAQMDRLTEARRSAGMWTMHSLFNKGEQQIQSWV